MTTLSKKEVLPHGLIVERCEDKIILRCHTSANKERIKALGAGWNPETNSWSLPIGSPLDTLRSRRPDWICCEKAHSVDAWNRTLVCATHFPSGKKPFWFCGHVGAKVLNLNLRIQSCEACAAAKSSKN